MERLRDRVRDRISDSVRDRIRDKVRMVIRVGWVAKGLLFVIIGFLGFELARRNFGTEDADQGGALALIADAPAGRVLVFVVGVGLLLFAVWEWWSAVSGDENDLIGIAHRVGRFGVGIAYALLGVTGIEAALTRRSSPSSGGGPTSPEGLTNRLFELPFGRVLTVALGAGTIVVGLYQLWSGWRDNFIDEIETDDLDRPVKSLLTVLGGAGTAARASTLVIIGVLFMLAAWRYDPSKAAGLDQSLRTMAEGILGRGFLALASLGLAAGGVYDIVTFRRRRLD